MKKFISHMMFAGLMALGIASCGETEEAYNCADICMRYDECVNEDSDVTQCISECENKADQDQDFADKADECEACLDNDESCLESLPCVNECAGVLP